MVITAAAGQQPTARLAAPTTALLSPVIANVPTIAPAETIKQEPASLASVATRSADTAVPIAVAQISTQPFVTPTTTTAASPVQPQTPGQPLNAQIFKPIFNLARAGNGEHTITVNVTPDNLGPVTVHAHVSGKDMRIELFAPTDGGRDALKAIMTDLRRDVAQAGLTAAVDVSTRNQPDSTQSGDRDRREQPFENREPSRREPQTTEAQVPPHVTDGGPTSSTLDVLA
jgi:flagellar hook-length control protein FliK